MPPTTRNMSQLSAQDGSASIETQSERSSIRRTLNDNDLTIHSFYHKVLKSLSSTIKALEKKRLLSERVSVPAERALGLLYLWAHGIDLHYFEKEVDCCMGLQGIVAEYLVSIARALETGNLAKFGSKIGEIYSSSFLAKHLEESDLNSMADRNDCHGNTTDSYDIVDVQHSDSDDQYMGSFERINDDVEGLMDLVPTIDSCCNEVFVALPAEEAIKSQSRAGTTSGAHPYILQVQDKFPLIKDDLAQRLGSANWSRFRRLGALRDLTESRQDANETVGMMETDEKYSRFMPLSEFQDSGLGASLSTQSKYARSNVSHKSYLSTQTSMTRGALRVPPTPLDVIREKPFLCEICGVLLSKIQNRVDWKMHVFADIQPYICTFTGTCKKDGILFPTRKMWADHEFSEHRKRSAWRCFGCKEDFPSPETFLEHRMSSHKDPRGEDREWRAATVKASEISLSPFIELERCPFCDRDGFINQRAFVSHVCCHMEEIALIVLPKDVDSDDEGEQDSASTNMVAPSAADEEPDYDAIEAEMAAIEAEEALAEEKYQQVKAAQKEAQRNKEEEEFAAYEAIMKEAEAKAEEEEIAREKKRTKGANQDPESQKLFANLKASRRAAPTLSRQLEDTTE